MEAVRCQRTICGNPRSGSDHIRDGAELYGRRQHIINLFLWPSADSTAITQAEADRGYQSVHGAAGGVAFWAISDLNAGELRQFVRLAVGR